MLLEGVLENLSLTQLNLSCNALEMDSVQVRVVGIVSLHLVVCTPPLPSSSTPRFSPTPSPADHSPNCVDQLIVALSRLELQRH